MKIEIYAIGIYRICLYEQQGNSTFVSVRHTYFNAKIGVPPFPCTVGMKCVTRWRTEPCGVSSLDVSSLS